MTEGAEEECMANIFNQVNNNTCDVRHSKKKNTIQVLSHLIWLKHSENKHNKYSFLAFHIEVIVLETKGSQNLRVVIKFSISCMYFYDQMQLSNAIYLK